MARPQRVTEAEILEAARLTFLAGGAQAPLSAVARRLGVSAAALLHRAGSKDALMTRALEAPVDQLMTAFALEPTGKNLEALLLQLSEFLARQLPNIVVLRSRGRRVKLRAPPPPVMLRRALTQWLSPLRLRVSTEVAAEALLGALEARTFNRYLGGGTFAPGDDRAFLQTMIDGLLKGSP